MSNLDDIPRSAARFKKYGKAKTFVNAEEDVVNDEVEKENQRLWQGSGPEVKK